MLKSWIIAALLAISLALSSCSPGVGNLQSYVDAKDGYEFLYPNGWVQVEVKNASPGVDLVFHDLIEKTENLSVIVSDLPSDRALADLGTPSEVGYRFLKQIGSGPGSEREADLISAQSHEAGGKTYYILEYQVKLPGGQERHDLASVAISRDKLFTFNLSTPQYRWPKVKSLFKTAVNSFSVY